MTKTAEVLNIEEASTRLGELVRLALEGTAVVITADGLPLVRLVPADSPHLPRIAGLNEGQAWMSDDFNAELPDEFWFPEG
jgi:prevent-host-death family protein